MKQFCKKYFSILLIATVLQSCAKQTPTETVVSHHIQLVNEAVDYAQNNMSDDADIKLLINSLKNCGSGLVSAEQAYKGEISTCEAKVRYWQLATLGLFLLLCGAIFALIKRVFK